MLAGCTISNFYHISGGRHEGCGGHLVDIAAGVAAAEHEVLAVLLGHEAEGEGGLCVDEVHGVAVGTHEDEGHGAVPQVTDAAPAGGHAVEVFRGAGGDEHPLLADELHGAGGDFGDVDILHNSFSFCKTARPKARRSK